MLMMMLGRRVTITTYETVTLSIMQNILRWKFNLNFPAKFDLSVAGHQI